MENLQELSNQLDNIKEKLTDKEYKDLMELTQKIHINKKKYVKCLIGIIKLNIYEKEEQNDMELNIVGNCFKHQGYDQTGDHNIHITPNVKFEEKILEVREIDDGAVHLNVDDNFMCNQQYELIKKNTYQKFDFPDNDDCDIVVYLGDL